MTHNLAAMFATRDTIIVVVADKIDSTKLMKEFAKRFSEVP